MKRLIALTLLFVALPSAAADQLHNYCFKLADVARTIVLQHDQGAPMDSLNRNILNANGVSEQDLRTILLTTYQTHELDGLTLKQVTLGTYQWCLEQHQVDFGGYQPSVAGAP